MSEDESSDEVDPWDLEEKEVDPWDVVDSTAAKGDLVINADGLVTFLEDVEASPDKSAASSIYDKVAMVEQGIYSEATPSPAGGGGPQAGGGGGGIYSEPIESAGIYSEPSGAGIYDPASTLPPAAAAPVLGTPEGGLRLESGAQQSLAQTGDLPAGILPTAQLGPLGGLPPELLDPLGLPADYTVPAPTAHVAKKKKKGKKFGARRMSEASVAVGETVILLHPPSTFIRCFNSGGERASAK